MPGTGTESPATPLVASKTTIDFGIVPQHGQQRLFFELCNVSGGVVELDRVEITCDCLEIRLAEQNMPTGSKALVLANLDLRTVPDFVGGLEIDVKGLNSGGDILFQLNVLARVCESEQFSGFEMERPAAPVTVPKPEPMPSPAMRLSRDSQANFGL